MRTRLIAAVLAVVLALVGTVVLLMYVRSASSQTAVQQAAPVSTVDVLVATGAIMVGSPSGEISKLVATKALPADAVLPNRVTDVAQLAGKVALVALEPGEQLLRSKFGAPPAQTTSATVSIPVDLQQVTILLRPDRALGGHLKPGNTVGVFISLKNPPQPLTRLVLHKVLVTAVEESAPPAPSVTSVATAPMSTPGATAAATVQSAPAATVDPTASVLITLATTAGNAERIVFAAENGSIWLSNEPLTAAEKDTGIIDGKKVLG